MAAPPALTLGPRLPVTRSEACSRLNNLPLIAMILLITTYSNEVKILLNDLEVKHQGVKFPSVSSEKVNFPRLNKKEGDIKDKGEKGWVVKIPTCDNSKGLNY